VLSKCSLSSAASWRAVQRYACTSSASSLQGHAHSAGPCPVQSIPERGHRLHAYARSSHAPSCEVPRKDHPIGAPGHLVSTSSHSPGATSLAPPAFTDFCMSSLGSGYTDLSCHVACLIWAYAAGSAPNGADDDGVAGFDVLSHPLGLTARGIRFRRRMLPSIRKDYQLRHLFAPERAHFHVMACYLLKKSSSRRRPRRALKLIWTKQSVSGILAV
jgi:hypothetical protein